MRNRIFTLAIIASMAAGSSSLAFAQDPISAAIGTAGAIAGGAIGTAGAIAGGAVGVAAGTAGAVTGASPYGPYPYGYYGQRCPRGYVFDEGACYPR
jgi:hypothetical protein